MVSVILQIFIHILLVFLMYFVIKYRYKSSNNNIIQLSKKTKKKLLKTFKPKTIVPQNFSKHVYPSIKYNFASFDFFSISNRYREEIKNTIAKYGIGACGPRGFFGTFPVHLSTEHAIAQLFNRPSAILYSNYYTAIQSVINCFCQNERHTVFYYSQCNEAIQEEIKRLSGESIEYNDLISLESKLKDNNVSKLVIAEQLTMKTGVFFDVEKLLELKKHYKFRLIVDVSLSYPMLFSKAENEFKNVDVVVGSLSHGYAGQGAFSCGESEIVEFQRLNGTGYTFSVSLSAFQTKLAECLILSKFDNAQLEKVNETAHNIIENIVSDRRSAMLLIKSRDVNKLHKLLALDGYLTGINEPFLRICLNVNHNDENIKELNELIKKYESKI